MTNREIIRGDGGTVMSSEEIAKELCREWWNERKDKISTEYDNEFLKLMRESKPTC